MAGGIAPVIDSNFWGRHLRADFIHDGFRGANYNIGGSNAARERGVEYSEESYWTEVMVDRRYSTPEINARLDSKIHFKIPEKTESFKPLPMLAVTGNASIGIVMDAGANITEELGAKNVITFGMCLDPASSPIAPSSNPMFFLPSPRVPVEIRLGQFGFDASAIQAIRITDMSASGMAVKTEWVMGDGTVHQPMPDGKYKIINKIDGNYSGRRTVTDLNDMIGKTLGDTMIVASAMPVFEGGVSNLYYGGRVPVVGRYDGSWFKLNSEEPIPESDIPSTLVVKTGDRPNAIRAIFKSVPVILERYVDDRVVKQFDYYPGESDPKGTLSLIRSSYSNIPTAVETRYTNLITQFRTATDNPDNPETIKLQAPYSRFVNEEVSTHPKNIIGRHEPYQRRAGKLFYDIRQTLGQLKNATTEYFRGRQRYFQDILDASGNIMPAAEGKDSSRIIAEYNQDLAAFKSLCPQTDTILRDPDTKVMNPIIPIVQPIALPSAPAPIPAIEIRLLSAFLAITAGSPSYDGTQYHQRFVQPAAEFLRILPPPPAPVAPEPAAGPALAAPAVALPPPTDEELATAVESARGAAASPEGDLNDYAAQVIGEGFVGGGQSGGARTIAFLNTRAQDSVLANTAPILTRFIEYYDEFMGQRTPDRLEYVRAAYGLLPSVTSPRIASPVLLERMKEEFDHLVETGVLTIEDDGGAQAVIIRSTRDSLIYNAFSMHINNLNLTELDSSGFHILEQKFREAAGKIRLSRLAEVASEVQAQGIKRGPPPPSPGREEARSPRPRTDDGDGGAGPAAAGAPAPAPAFAPAVTIPVLGSDGATGGPLTLSQGVGVTPPLSPAAPRGMGSLLSPRGPRDTTPPPSGAAPAPSTVVRAGDAARAAAVGEPIVFREIVGDSQPHAGGRRTPRRKNRRSTYRLKKKPTK